MLNTNDVLSKPLHLLQLFLNSVSCRFSRKQKKIPVKIGVCGETDKYPVYKDIRIRTVGMAVGFSHSERILGVSCFCEHVLTSPSTVNKIMDKDLILSTWGEDNNQHDVREKQREMGVNVLCYDRFVKTGIN